MDNPTEEITQVVHTLCQGTPDQQTEAINTYFTPNASFTHPFCRTGSFDGSRNLIHAIYKWYKLLSPKIELNVNSIGKIHPSTLPSINPHNSKLTSLPTTAYDSHNLILYLNITQILSFWMIPFHHANVTLTTELHLTRPPNSRKFYIKAQNDLYQNDQLIRFFMPFGLGELSMHMWQYSSTMMCVFGAFLLAPATRLQQSWLEQQGERMVVAAAVAADLLRGRRMRCGAWFRLLWKVLGTKGRRAGGDSRAMLVPPVEIEDPVMVRMRVRVRVRARVEMRARVRVLVPAAATVVCSSLATCR
jgi:hypothetical protein